MTAETAADAIVNNVPIEVEAVFLVVAFPYVGERRPEVTFRFCVPKILSVPETGRREKNGIAVALACHLVTVLTVQSSPHKCAVVY